MEHRLAKSRRRAALVCMAVPIKNLTGSVVRTPKIRTPKSQVPLHAGLVYSTETRGNCHCHCGSQVLLSCKVILSPTDHIKTSCRKVDSDKTLNPITIVFIRLVISRALPVLGPQLYRSEARTLPLIHTLPPLKVGHIHI